MALVVAGPQLMAGLAAEQIDRLLGDRGRDSRQFRIDRAE
jgi:hypothetical protein